MAEVLKKISLVNMQQRGGQVVFGDVVYPPGGVCGPRVQQDYQLVVMRRGTLDLRLNRRRIHLSAGQAILLLPGQHEHFIFTPEADTHHSWCSIQRRGIPRKLAGMLKNHPGPSPLSARGFMLLDLGLVSPQGSAGLEAIENACYLELGLTLLCDFIRGAKANQQDQPLAQEALDRFNRYVSREYMKSLSLQEMAVASGVSRQHLMRLCRLHGYPTPTAYLYRKRLETASDWLAHTGLSIGEIAQRCGFANPFHFSRKFKEAYGRGPLQWRKQLWNNHRSTKM